METEIVTVLLKKSLVAVACAMTVFSAFSADPFPSRPIKIVSNTVAGGQLDVYARVIAQEMSKSLGQPVIVENKAGADGLIGIRHVKSAPADGYTILAASNTFAQNPALKGDTGYEVARDFVGIGMISQSPLVMVTAASHSEKTVADVIASAKANPNKLTYASGGIGTSTHMAAALFLKHAGVKLLHVPYKGNAASQSDVLSGRISINFDGASTAIPHVKEGRLRALGLTTPKRSASFPEIPPLAEQGLPGYEFVNYFGLHVPAATPKDLVQRLNEALRIAQNSETARERFGRDGAVARFMTPEEFTAFVREDSRNTAQIARDIGLLRQ
jgi:tripartite-type tricarboxylate transporter receptor subunit TctC